MSKKTIKSGVKMLSIIEGLKELEGARITELADHLDMTKATVHHHLSTLEQEEYVVKENKTYYTGLRFLELGERARDRLKIQKVAQPEIEKLATETGELANVAVEEHGWVVYLYRARGEDAVHLDTYTGKRVLPHCTALGKAMIAHFDEQRVEEIISRFGLPANTEHTITDRDQLFQELEEIRKSGIAFDREEAFSGLRCIAVPIVDNSGNAVGAISVSGPTSRMKGERFKKELPETIDRAANVIELNITYS
ncbi:IclR family transcriptional regulator [Halobellus captivus]|uniref:IclR family transcriptional regulator n=1 Tax=Halobellus captivus TaxID=2592614 RepID=UPI0011A61D7E|nr:IclR family transcriptional regulator [Halobellus captivus]